MTASKELLGGGASKTKKVLGTTLAGALAVGMVPAAGIAATADQAIADDGDFELLADVSPADNFSKGTISDLTLSAGSVAEVPGEANTFSTNMTNGEFSVDSVVMTTFDDTQVAADYAPGKPNYKITVTNASGNQVAKITELGTYKVTVTATADSQWNGGSLSVTLKVEGVDIANKAVGVRGAYNAAQTTNVKGAGPSTGWINTFPYTGEAQKVGFFSGDGSPSSRKAFAEGTDYTVKYYKDQTATEVAAADLVEPGRYYADVTGIGKYTGLKRVYFNITSLNLGTDITDITLNPQTEDNWYFGRTASMPVHPYSVTINGVEYKDTDLTNKITLTYTKGGTSITSSTLGTIDIAADVTVATPAYTQVTGNKGVGTFYAHRALSKATFYYNGKEWPSGAQDITSPWNNSAVTATYGNVDIALPTSAFVWKDPNGANNAPSGNNYGKYELTVTATDASNNYGGTAKMTVNYYGGTIDCGTNLTVYYDSKNVESINAEYTGSNIASDITAVLKNNKGATPATIPAGDYSFEFYDSEGNKVASVVDAGSYTMKVVSEKYVLTNNEVAVTVKPVDIATLKMDESQLTSINGEMAFPYAKGSYANVTGALQYKYASAPASAAAAAWDSPNGYSLVVTDAAGKEVDIAKVEEIGTYTVKAVPADRDSKNYVVSAPAVTFKVATPLTFVDVPTSYWAHDVIETASGNGYMSGYNGTKLFGPNDPITRAQVACVLYNMAGGYIDPDAGQYNENSGWKSFDDVDGHMYYSKAVAWAKEAGVINGFAGTNNFGPEQNITREQFACMLANYAKKAGNFRAADTEKVLSGMPDGASVDSWARENVAWAVSGKIMGNGGSINPLGIISRAETAAMAVNYQPQRLNAAPAPAQASTNVSAMAATWYGKNETPTKTSDYAWSVKAPSTTGTGTLVVTLDSKTAKVTAADNVTAVSNGSGTATLTLGSTSAGTDYKFKVTDGDDTATYTLSTTDGGSADAPTSKTVNLSTTSVANGGSVTATLNVSDSGYKKLKITGVSYGTPDVLKTTGATGSNSIALEAIGTTGEKTTVTLTFSCETPWGNELTGVQTTASSEVAIS